MSDRFDPRATTLARSNRRCKPISARFWRYVSPEPNSGCWLWDGSIDRRGYGQLRIVSASGKNCLVYATHVSLAIHDRPVVDGMCACHRCDNPICVNPDHLFVGSQHDNMRDCMAKGRHSKPPIRVKGQIPLKNVCIHGHAMVPDNVYIRPDGCRACRECRRVAKRVIRARKASPLCT